jgi:hypothetical protein
LAPLQGSPAVWSTSATFPAVPLRLGLVAVMSASGSGTPLAVLPASLTSTRWPASIEPESATGEFEAKLPVPPALAYWIDLPVRGTSSVPRLNSSTKSFW